MGMDRKKVGIVIDYNFHSSKRWRCFLTWYLWEAVHNTFDGIWITSQAQYDAVKEDVDYIFTGEFGAPRITYDTTLKQKIAIIMSDPHDKKDWFLNYIFENDIDHVLAFCDKPTQWHLPDLPKERLVSFPWSIPHTLANWGVKNNHKDYISLCGAMGGRAYKDRAWCDTFDFVRANFAGGCGKNLYTEKEYFDWLNNQDFVIAAGSDDFKMVTPKYFEIANSGALLIAQDCPDLEDLGFNERNCVIFTKNNFEEKCQMVLDNPDKYIKIRKAGQELIRSRHLVGHRMKQLRELWSR